MISFGEIDLSNHLPVLMPDNVDVKEMKNLLSGYRFDVSNRDEFYAKYGDIGLDKRNAFVKNYSWCIPDQRAIDIIKQYPRIVEMGAGTGLWAAILATNGVEVEAYDLDPLHVENHYHTKNKSYYPVKQGDYSVLLDNYERYKDYALMLIWPPYGDSMAYNCLQAFSGNTLIYIGEDDGGCTGDEKFFELLRDEWESTLKDDNGYNDYIEIEQWDGLHDYLYICTRKVQA